jgi:hypothetical protein
VEQLELILTRAGSASLKLEVVWPVAEGSLELISSRKCPIRSLRILYNTTSIPLSISSFQDLNLSEVQELELGELSWDRSIEAMDLALQSICTNITLEVNYGSLTPNLLKHALIQQVTTISIINRLWIPIIIAIYTDIRYTVRLEDNIYLLLSDLRGISFPSIRNWRILGQNELVASLDLSNADTLDFQSDNSPMGRFLAPIPNQLTALKLEYTIFTPESLPDGSRHSLLLLTSLTLVDVIFFGPICKYLHCPKLNHLCYTISSDNITVETAVEVSRNPYRTPIQEIFGDAFFQETPVLNFIYLEGTTINDALVPILESRVVLQSLEIRYCLMEGFIKLFLGRLQDPKYLLALQMLRVDNSWPSQPELPLAEFVTECNSRRPGLYVVGSE